MLWDLREAYRAEQNPTRKQELQNQHDRALNAALEITDKIIGDNTAAYNKAVEALENSIADLRQTKRELGNVAQAIARVAKAVDLIVKVSRLVAV